MLVFKLFKYFISLIYWNMQPVEKVKEMQLRKFKEVFEYARANNPFYRDLYTKAGVMDFLRNTINMLLVAHLEIR